MSDFKIGDDHRRRTTDQLEHLRRTNEGLVDWDTEAPADFTYLYDPDHVLVRRRRRRAGRGRVPPPPAGRRTRPAAHGRAGGAGPLPADRPQGRRDGRRHPRPARRGPRAGAGAGHSRPLDPPVPAAGTACPATEPEETGLRKPWPPLCDEGRGKGVQVVVVDTGWHPPAATDPRTPWMHDIDGDDENNGPVLREYAGHGTHIAGHHPLPGTRDRHVRRGFRGERHRRRRHPRVGDGPPARGRRCATSRR